MKAVVLSFAILLHKTRGFVVKPQKPSVFSPSCRTPSSKLQASLEELSTTLNSALEVVEKDISKVCKVKVGPVGDDEKRLGLIATKDIRKGDAVLAMPYIEDRCSLTAEQVRDEILRGILPEGYDGWTGDNGLIALGVLNEVARAAGKGIAIPKRDNDKHQAFMNSWVAALPSPSEPWHPLLWSEGDQEVLQSSSTTKIYKLLDDIDEDAAWLTEKVWSKDRDKFPEMVSWNGIEVPCFTAEGYKWAMAIASSRSIFCDSALRMMPMLDMANHDDNGQEIVGGTMGAFGTTKGATLTASKAYKVGDEVFCSYGPKSAADYLLEHGFCPQKAWKTAVSELTFEVDSEDRFYDDKLDILEFETYDLAPIDPTQSFDLVSEPGRDGEPDPAMIQFLRLCKLGGTDAFLLESIFRKEVWGFMSLPVSEMNELAVVETIIAACDKALEDFSQCPEEGPEVCSKLRESETKALKRTKQFLLREKEALDLKEYYQERRLKDLGLDSEWNPEEDNDLLGYGQTREPGAADYDW